MPKINEGVVGARCLKSAPFFYRLIDRTNPEQRIRMIENASAEELHALIDVCANLLAGYFVLNQREQRKLDSFLNHMKRIKRQRTRSGILRAVQHGEGLARQVGGAGFLPALLVPILVEIAASGGEKLLSYLSKE